ncbi:MAG TPA: carboxypeptidase regulatory-like domain-containing protein, partial [Bryobacteraceae bacterium]|nr:carboxypeptidase regulatory-like domain-containing protein [Bryobacteraceae bacterium]
MLLLSRALVRTFLAGALAAISAVAAEHHGTVRFAGLPVPGATITATQGDKKLSTVTGANGAYSFPDLADGTWNLQVDMLCFAPMKQDVSVAAGAEAPVFDLKLLPIEDIRAISPAAAPPEPTAAPTPQQTSAAPAKPPATTQTARKGKGRTPPVPTNANPQQLGFQRAQVNASATTPAEEPSAATPAEPTTTPNAVDAFNINGSANNAAASNFGMSAAFGNGRRGPGSLYNGNIGAILGNSALDARSFSLTGQDTAKPAYNRINASAQFGGPLRIPHLFNANNAPNFFVSYQMSRNRTASIQPALVPTANERLGILSQTVLDPSTGNPFPGNVIPTSLLSQAAKTLVSFYPLPNFTGSSQYNYQTALRTLTNMDNVQSRLSKAINRTDQVFGTFGYQSSRGLTPNLFSFVDSSESSGIDLTANWTHRFSQRMFLTSKINFNRLSTRLTPEFANKRNIALEAGIVGSNQEPTNWGPPGLNFSSGYASLGDAQYSFNRSQTSAASVSIYWNHSPHNFTYGGDYKRQQFNYLGQQDARGNFTFTGAATKSDFGGFLLGIPDTSSIAFGNADKYFRSSLYDGYITDDWRVSPSLTANIGVRWEYNAPITELYGRLVNLDVTPGFKAAKPVVANQPVGPLTNRTYADSLVNPVKSAFQPRIGLAWRPVAGDSMVVRSGYGVTYNTSVYQSIAIQMAQQSPLSKSLSVQNTPTNPLTLANGFVQPPNTTANTFGIDPDFRIGYTHTWSLTVQRDLPASLIATATYLGIKGTRAPQAFLPNTYPGGVINPCLSCPSGFTYLSSNGNSTREALQAQLRRRLHHGFTATANYTFSKAIDDGALGGRGAVNLIAQDWTNLAGERGLSNFDQRHVLTLQTQYSTGVGLRGGALLDGWRGTAVRDWTITSSLNAGSGTPLSPVYFAAVRGTGVTGPLRPDYTGAALYDAPSGLFLNPAAYRAPANGTWGN